MLRTILFPVALASLALAAPTQQARCDISQAEISLPAGQTTIVSPSATPSFIAVAIGVQNYTCSSSGTYTNVGAVAELFDIGCLYNTPLFSSTQDIAIALWEAAPPTVTAQSIISLLHSASTPQILGQHYYVPNPITGVGVNPKWDFTSQGAYAGNPDAYVVAARVAGISAPTGSHDIDWVSLKQIAGDLASDVYRVDTRGGQPPASCAPGSPEITVKYASKYWLFGGSVAQ